MSGGVDQITFGFNGIGRISQDVIDKRDKLKRACELRKTKEDEVAEENNPLNDILEKAEKLINTIQGSGTGMTPYGRGSKFAAYTELMKLQNRSLELGGNALDSRRTRLEHLKKLVREDLESLIELSTEDTDTEQLRRNLRTV